MLLRGWDMTNQDAEDSDLEYTETPFDPERGIWFKYGSVFADKEREIAEFEEKLGLSLPRDFVELIGEYCEGGFDGWYRVARGGYGTVVWQHLLLMRVSKPTDVEYLSKKNVAAWTIYEYRHLFAEGPLLRYFPFGEAACFRDDGSGDKGFLVFDRRDNDAVKYVSQAGPKVVPLARTFTEMMHNSFFQFFG